MKRLPLILLIYALVCLSVTAQTKKTTTKVTAKKTTIQQPTKPVTIAKSTPPIQLTNSTTTLTVKLPKFETEILAELNLFRTNPAAYAKHLEDYLKSFNGKYFKNGEGIDLESFEGKTPVVEAIAVLKQTAPLPEFKTADGMVKGALDHSQDLQKNNRTGHRGTDGSLPMDRVSRYGIAASGVFENISYSTNTARDVVLTMLIDDGNANRNHRKNLLNPQLKIVGLAAGDSKDAGKFCVLVLAASFAAK